MVRRPCGSTVKVLVELFRDYQVRDSGFGTAHAGAVEKTLVSGICLCP